MPRKKRPSNRPLRKSVTIKHWEALLASGATLNEYAYRVKVYRSPLILSFLKYLPAEWEAHKHKLGSIQVGVCGNCGLQFYKNAGQQRFCGEACSKRSWMSRNPDQMEKNRQKVARWKVRQKQVKQGLVLGDGAQDPAG